MIVFKPRLALFYIAALVVISLLTNRLTITSQIAAAMSTDKKSDKTIDKTTDTTNVESSD